MTTRAQLEAERALARRQAEAGRLAAIARHRAAVKQAATKKEKKT